MKNPTGQFENSPLISPLLARREPDAIFRAVPGWVVAWAIPGYANEDDNLSRAVALAIGKRHRVALIITSLQYALIAEATRLGHSITTNSNFKKPTPKVYGKMTFRGAAKDAMPIWRLFAGAKAHEAVSALEIARDLRPHNLIKTDAGKPEKDALAVLTSHVERIASERELSLTMPKGLSTVAYLENFRALLAAVEEERDAAGQ